MLPGCNQIHGATVYSVSWSLDGNYLAIGGEQGTGSFDERVYRFNESLQTLSELSGCQKNHGIPVSAIYSVSWSPDASMWPLVVCKQVVLICGSMLLIPQLVIDRAF